MFLISTFRPSLKCYKYFNGYSLLKAKKNFFTSNYDSAKNDRMLIFYPEFLGIEYKNKKNIDRINLRNLTMITSINILKSLIVMYTTSIFYLFPEQVIFHLIKVNNFIYKLYFFFILVLITKKFFLKILKYSKFIPSFIVILFLFTISTITDYFLEVVKILKKYFFLTTIIKFLVIKDLWFDNYFNSEIKSTFFLNSMFYRMVKTVITVIFLLDIIFKICIYSKNLEKIQYFLSLTQLTKFTHLFIYSTEKIFFNKIVNSTYSILILCVINCIIIFLYFLAFYRKKSKQNNTKILYTFRNYNFLNKSNRYLSPLCRFLFLERKNENLLIVDKLPVNGSNWNSLEEKKRWVIKKNAINIPFGIILYANEFQVTKQKIWYEIRNRKS
nr:hypothetical protein CcurKRNrm2_p096 [Cryptomonas curvata]